ncbi:hypothetical protein K8R43_03085 [archaeon]|nr:hypothetical protein [archaeon]
MKKELLVICIVFVIAVALTLTINMDEHSHDEDHVHDHSVEIEGKELKALSIQEVADLWEIESDILLSELIQEFDLKESYTKDSILEDIREEYAFSPALVKDIAEELKQGGVLNE